MTDHYRQQFYGQPYVSVTEGNSYIVQSQGTPYACGIMGDPYVYSDTPKAKLVPPQKENPPTMITRRKVTLFKEEFEIIEQDDYVFLSENGDKI